MPYKMPPSQTSLNNSSVLAVVLESELDDDFFVIFYSILIIDGGRERERGRTNADVSRLGLRPTTRVKVGRAER